MQDADFQKLIEESEYTTFEYSGRSMYGSKCLAVRLDRDQSVFDFIADLIDIFDEQVSDIEKSLLSNYVRDINQDSLGLGTVIYFPNVKYTELLDEEEDAEDDDE